MSEEATGVKQPTARRTGREPLWSGPFRLTCAAYFLCYANIAILEPLLPLYLTGQGLSPAFVGLIFATFSLVSIIGRPLLGQRVDRGSARGVLLSSGLGLGATSLFYLLPSTLALLATRAAHGIGWAGINIAAPALAAERSPASRRGEAIAYFSMMPGLAHAFMPALAFRLLGSWDFTAVFLTAALAGFGAGWATSRMPELPRARRPEATGSSWAGLIEWRVWLASVLLFLMICALPATHLYAALYARSRGIEDPSLYFLAAGLTQAVSRFSAPLSDRWGRGPLIAAGFVLAVLGLTVLMSAEALFPMVIGGMFANAGVGVAGPAMLALAFDKAPPNRRGAAMATYTVAHPMAVAVAGFASGLLIEWIGFSAMYLFAIVTQLVGIAVIAASWRSASPKRAGGGSFDGLSTSDGRVGA